VILIRWVFSPEIPYGSGCIDGNKEVVTAKYFHTMRGFVTTRD